MSQRNEIRAILSLGVLGEATRLAEPLRRQAERWGGWLFRLELENLWFSFPGTRDALEFCVAASQVGPDQLRFGLDLGEVTLTAAGDVLGHTLSVARRLETASQVGELLATQDAVLRWGELPQAATMVGQSMLDLKGVGAVFAWRIRFGEDFARPDWESLNPQKSLVCWLGPWGGECDLQQWLPGPGDFYERAEDFLHERGRAALGAAFSEWCQGVGSSPSSTALTLPCLAFFPDPRWSAEVFCLGGRAHDPGECVLTESDLDQLWPRLPALLKGWEERLTRHRLLWVGPSVWVEAFQRELRRRFPRSAEGRDIWLCEESTGVDALRWRNRGFLLWKGQREELVRRFSTLPGEFSETAPGVLEGGRPYRFLDAYGPRDRALFFGRERESGVVTSWILTRPWLVLYGRSGVGKSSLLGAGVIPRLLEAGCRLQTIRCLQDPRPELKSLLDWKGPARWVLILDQFEEFFLRLSAEVRKGVGEWLHTVLVEQPSPWLHVLFSLREDFLAEMAALEEWVPTLLDSRFRLTALTRSQARESILEPARIFGLRLDNDLVEVLLDELQHEGVEPPELQIVMDRLWDLRQHQGLSLSAYREVGGVRTVLLEYLQGALEGRLRGGDWSEDFPRRVMAAMVTEHGTKSALPASQLDQKLGHPPHLEEVLALLVDLRLARRLGEGHDPHYELSHEYLIEEIQNWASEEELAERHARMVLQSEVESWQSLGSLMTADRLQVVARELPRLGQLTPAEGGLLLRASMVWGQPLDLDWPGAPEMLLGMLDENWDGSVIRRILQRLARTRLEGRAGQRYLEAVRAVSNPTLVQALRAPLHEWQGPQFLAAVESATRERFFGAEAMVCVPGGPAWIGSDLANRQARKELLPRYWHARLDSEPCLHTREVETFWIDRTPVTNLQFAEFRPDHIDRYPDEEDHHPVVSVSWYDAQAYAQWLGKELVEEVMWEKAARSATASLYPWGDEFDPSRLNSQESGLRSTNSVTAYTPNPLGIREMAGNIWEWTATAWSEGSPFKVQKGGSTLNPAPLQQCSTRQEAFPDFVLQWVGFRLMSREAR